MWILGPWADTVLIVGSPLLVIAALTIARGVWSGAVISSFVMIWAIGHHLPGMMRAYGDPGLFRRFRIRFILAPLVLLSACGFAFWTGVNSGVLAIASVWGWWHYLMQAYGFCRIYDSKVGAFAASTRGLDQAMCLTWFGAAVVLNDNTLYGFISNFHNSGLPIPSESFLAGLRSAVGAVTAAVTVLFLVNLAWRWRLGERSSWVKVATMLTTFGCFWYSAATVSNLVVAYAFFELFHDVQYLTIVWVFNRSRAAKDATLRGFTPWLFQPRVIFVLIYLALIFGYGSLKYGSMRVEQANLQRLLAGVFLTSTLLHYYFDGFIWKLRDSETQATLDLPHNAARRRRWSFPRVVRHALLWCLFLVPYGWLSVAQVQDAISRNELDEAGRLQRRMQESAQFAQVLPNSFMAQFTLGLASEYADEFRQAGAAYEKALACYPGHQPSQEGLRRIARKQRSAAE